MYLAHVTDVAVVIVGVVIVVLSSLRFRFFGLAKKKMAQGKQAAPFQINITGGGTKLYLIAVNRYVWIFANSFTFLLFTTNTNKGTATLKINTYVCTQSRVL